MESKEVSYISTRLANDADVQEMLDSARIAAAKSSPMMECVNHVLQFVDGDTLTLLIPKLIDLIKSSIGLATRGTAAHVVVSLTHQCPLELQAKSLYITLAWWAFFLEQNLSFGLVGSTEKMGCKVCYFWGHVFRVKNIFFYKYCRVQTKKLHKIFFIINIFDSFEFFFVAQNRL